MKENHRRKTKHNRCNNETHLGNSKNPDIFAKDWPILTKAGIWWCMMHLGPLDPISQ